MATMATMGASPPKEESKRPAEAFESPLLAAPLDIFMCIAECLDTASLLRLEPVCRTLHARAQEAYQANYGPGPVHRKCHPINFRTLAIEQFQFAHSDNAKDCSPEKQSSMLLGDVYRRPSKELRTTASDALLRLQRISGRGTDAWNEAAATALMAQGRYGEAGEYYRRLASGGNPLPERTVLAAARWSWPFTIPLPRLTSQEMFKNACLGAALSGDESLLRLLPTYKGPLNVLVSHDCPVTAVLKLVRDNNLHVAEYPQGRRRHSILFEPVKPAKDGDGDAAAQFLLEADAQPDIPVTAVVGGVDILRLFIQHTSIIGTTRTATDMLRIETPILQNQMEQMEFLFNEGFIDIHEADEAGQTAFHLAVDSDQPEIVDAVVALGADVHAIDACGQTAFERAVSRDSPIAHWLAQHMGRSLIGLKDRKILRAKTILKSQQRSRLGHMAGSINGLSLDEKIGSLHTRWVAECMEDKLSKMWARSMSITALDWYVEQILGSATEDIWYRVVLLAEDICAVTEDPWISEDGQDKFSTTRRIAAAIMPLESSSKIDRVARGIEQKIPIADLRELETHLLSPKGRMYVAGMKEKCIYETVALIDFARS